MLAESAADVCSAGGLSGNGGGKGPSKKELDEFGEDEDNMMNKAEVSLHNTSRSTQCIMQQYAEQEKELCTDKHLEEMNIGLQNPPNALHPAVI